MMGQLLTASSVLMCPHGGTVSVISTNTRANAVGAPILRPSDTFIIAGCGWMLGTVLHPCMTVRWIVPGLRGKALGDSVLTTDSVGLCLAADNAPQGPVMVAAFQPRVAGQ
jgi:hypothetical protein